MIVLGSGGHTSEMIKLIRGLDPNLYNPIVFVHADTDTKSMAHLRESNVGFKFSTRSIPRCREVGQSYVSSIASTVKAFLSCISLILQERPSLLLVNGPGTCIPVAYCVALFRVLNILSCRIVFVESFCRVQKLSVTGYLLYYVADSFVVQWPQLQRKYPRSVYLGILL
ncbi:hypothetical protein WA556_001110 [Blastocystis sp. ATCC 50177/Nand II]